VGPVPPAMGIQSEQQALLKEEGSIT